MSHFYFSTVKMLRKAGMKQGADERATVMENIFVVLSLGEPLEAEKRGHMLLLLKSGC